MAMAKPLPDLSVLDSLLSYDPDTGILRWKKTMNCKALEGGLAGSVKDNGYISFQINKQRVYAHRAAYSMHHRVFLPSDLQIDHIDRVRSNNSINNLRLVTISQNLHNAGKSKSATSKYFGVTFDKSRLKYVAQAPRLNGITKNLGRFSSELEAAHAYDKYLRANGIGFSNLNFPDKDGGTHANI